MNLPRGDLLWRAGNRRRFPGPEPETGADPFHRRAGVDVARANPTNGVVPRVTRSAWCRVGFAGLAAVAVGCGTTGGAGPSETGPRIVQPGAPGEDGQVIAAGETVDTSFPHTEADVAFMQGMIHHHAQAVVMTELAREHAGSIEVRRLALRIELSQIDEIALMRQWLEERGESVPTVSMEHLHHLSGDEREFMPGMLTHEQLQSLEGARGEEFDRLFLELMIQHHGGALIMVADLFATDGAAYEEEIHQFASHVEADQSIEIRRMLAMLEDLR